MSEGPIKQERRGHVAQAASTTAKDRFCASGSTPTHAYCGRSSSKRAATWDDVTCSDCHAALHADEMEQRRLDAIAAEHRAEWAS